ncbi:MAG: hypothetical protein U1F66_08255 [bacterium]
MEWRKIFWRTLVIGIPLSGLTACGGAGPDGLAALANISALQILQCPSSLALGEKRQLQARALDAQGNEVSFSDIRFRSRQDRRVQAMEDGEVEARYPGEAEVVAAANGIESDPCRIAVEPPSHQGRVRQLTDNDVEDHWGMNNNWPMLSRGRVLWLRGAASGNEVWLHDLAAMPGDDRLLRSTANGVDFMALGGGAGEDEVMATWREGLSRTLVSRDGAPALDLGAQLQEENSIADGHLLFRRGQPDNDILDFTFASGLKPHAETGDLYNPIADAGRALWLEDRGGGNFNLVYDGGQGPVTLAQGPFIAGRFDMRKGRIVYVLGHDIFLYDTEAEHPQSVNLTQNPQALNDYPRTDGDSVLFLRGVQGAANREVVLYDIASGQAQVISTTQDPKDGSRLQLDQRQALWVEGNRLYFHDGSGAASGTSAVPLGNAALDPFFAPFLAEGSAVWIANDGNDDELFVLE